MKSVSKHMFGAVLLATVSSTSFAGNTTQMAAGCGVGSLILQDQEGLVWTLLASTINGMTFNTISMTAGVLNCPESVSIKGKIASFIDFNKPQLAMETAQGSGEHLAALIDMLGVSDQSAAAASLKANYDSIFTLETGDAITAQIEKVLNIQLS